MILRRVIAHFRKQEWTAIGLDFIIVVVGVFIGIQVANWNEERQDNALSAGYLERLEFDIALEQARWGKATDYFSTARQYGFAALENFETPADQLDEQFLVNVYQASQVWFVLPNRATFDELSSTGRIVLIEDAELRTALSNHYVRVDALGVTLNQNSQYRRVARLNMDQGIQQQIRDNCGDQWVTDNQNFYYVLLPTQCEIDVPEQLLREEIAKLHENQEVLQELRFQMSVLDAQIGTLRNTMDTGGVILAKIREAQD